MKLWDISQPLRPGLPAWPGDTAFDAEPHWTYGPGCPVNVASVRMSTHSGTHADAPLRQAGSGIAPGAHLDGGAGASCGTTRCDTGLPVTKAPISAFSCRMPSREA